MNLLEMLTQRRLAAKILTLLVIGFGVLALFQLPLAEKPRLDMGEGVITTSFPASASDIESNITSKIEKELLSVSGIKEFVSVSEEGRSTIEFVVNSGIANKDSVYQDVRDAIARVSDLPSGVIESPTLSIKKSYSLDFMVVGISSDLPYAELRAKAKTLELALRRVKGIGKVNPIDLRNPEFLISIEPTQLQRYGLTINEIATFIAERNVLISGGKLENLKSNPEIITIAELDDINKLADMFIGFSPKIQLKDVTDSITNTFEKAEVFGSLNGQRSILFDLRTDEQADVLKTSEQVTILLAQMETQFGSDYKLSTGFDLANEIQSKSNIVQTNGLGGLLLVIVVLALFLDKRVAFWVAVSIPVCLLGTLALLPSLGQILDAYTLSALILIIGIIVDDAVVVSDKIISLTEEGQPTDEAIINGVKAVFPAVTASILSTMIAFIPLLFLHGNSGQMMYVIPLTVIIALCFSFIDALFFIPAHLKGILNSGKTISVKDNLFPRLNKTITWALRKRKYVVSISIALCIGLGAFSYQQLNFLFFPTDGAYLIEVSVDTDPELSLDQVWEQTQKLEALIKNTPEVVSWYGEVGTSSYFVVSLSPVNDRDRNAEDIVTEWETAVETIDGLTKVEFDIDGGGAPVGRPVDIKVVGGTNIGRSNMANALTEYLETLEGTRRVEQDLQDKQPRIEAQLQYQWLNYYNVSAGQVGNVIKFAVEGDRVSRIFNGEEEAFFRVTLEENDKILEEINNLTVRNNSGELIPLSKLVRWVDAKAESEISHYNGERLIQVTSGVDPEVTDPIEVFENVTNAFNGKNYEGARLVPSGQILETQEAKEALGIAILLVLVGIAVLLLVLFDRITEALVVLLVIPFGVSGALFILYIHDQVLSFFTIIGMIALLGIMVNNSLVLIWHFRSTMDLMNTNSVMPFIISGTKSRVRPILLTTITTVVGLIPLAYGLGGYDNLMSPMALVVGWGCVISMFTTLIIIPAIYGYILEWKIKHNRSL